MAIRWMGLTALVLAMGFASAATRSALAGTARSPEPALSQWAAQNGLERLWTAQWANEDIRTIEDVQRYLQSESLYAGPIDGAWGAATERGLIEMFDRAQVAKNAGRQLEAEQVYRLILAAGEIGWGEEHENTLNAMLYLAHSLSAQGPLESKDRFVEAEALRRRALEAQERVLGAEHPDTLHNLYNLGINLQKQGRYAEAEALQRRTLEAMDRAFGPEHASTLFSMNNLADSLESQGRYPEAEALYRRAQETQERVFGPEHPFTIISLNGLGGSLRSQARHIEAEGVYRRVLEATEREVGAESPYTSLSLNNLALTLDSQGRYPEAEALHRRALEGMEELFGPEHPDTLMSLGNLANNLLSQGRSAEAEGLHRRALEATERVLGAVHPDTLRSLNDLANTLLSQGRYAEAERFYRRALGERELLLGREHPSTLGSLNNLAISLAWQGKLTEAVTIQEQGFSALPGYFALGGFDAAGTQAGLLPLNLEGFLGDLATAAPRDAPARSFAVQGWLTYGQLDMVLGDLAARHGLDVETARALRSYQEARESLQSARRAYLDSFERVGAQADRSALAARVAAAEQAFEAQSDQIARDHPALAEIQLPSALTADEAQAYLRPGEGLLAFAQTDKVLHAWLVTRTRVEWQQISAGRGCLVTSI